MTAFAHRDGDPWPTLQDRLRQLRYLEADRSGAVSVQEHALEGALQAYDNGRAADGAPELTKRNCRALMAMTASDEPRTGESRARLNRAIAACRSLEALTRQEPVLVIMDAIRVHVQSLPEDQRSSITDGQLYQDYLAASAHIERTLLTAPPGAPEAPTPRTALEEIIFRAETENATPSADDVRETRRRINELFEGFDAVAAAAGWEHIEGELAALMRAELCDAKETDENRAARTEAKCDAIGPRSTTAKAQALWGLALAIAHNGDIRDPDWRDPRWLAAARAIAGLRARQRALALERERELAASAIARLNVSFASIRNIILAQRALAAPQGGCGQGGVNCALVHYARYWNEGEIPYRALRYGEVANERRYALRVARVSAESSATVLQSASEQLRVYGAGGFTSEEIARLIMAAGLGAAAN